MPDFDKDLRPTLLNKDETLPQLGNPLVPTPSSPYTQSVQARNSGPNTAIDAFFGAGPKVTEMAPTVSVAELQANKRYGIYNPETIDIEDQKANAQSSAVQATNGILKGLNLAATTVAGGFGMLGGTVQSMFTGRLADIWDNEAMRKLDEWNNKVDQEYLPNYYTNQEKQASWYSSDNWFTTNFLFDKLIKNAGFAVGAMVSGNIANAAVKTIGAGIGAFADAKATTQIANQAMKWYTPLLKNTARAFSSGKNIEVANALQKGISTVTELDAVTSEIGNIAKQFNAFNKINDIGRRTAVALYSQAGEASFEAMQTSKEYRENLINEWKAAHGGEEPNGEDLAIINRNSDRVGKMSFFGNMALLSVTEYAQLPKILGSSYAVEKEAANSFLGGVNEVVLKDGKYVAKQAVTKFGKLYDKVGGVTRYVADWKEGLQENLQYALQVGTQRYYNKAYQGKDAESLVDSMIYGLVGVNEKGEGVGSFVSNEGMESTVLGAITGGLMQARGTYQENKILNKNTSAFLDQINNAPAFKEAFIDRMRSINRGVVLQQQQQNAIIQGDKLEAKDLEADQMHNYLSTRIKYGRYDMVKEDIKDLQLASATEKGLAELKEQGIGNINDDIQSFQARLNNFERVANYTNELYKSMDLRFGGEVNEAGQRKYSPELIDKMVYAAAKISDYDLRIPQVNVELNKFGIVTQDVLNTWLKEGKSNKTATKEALKQINSIEDQIDDLDQPKVIKDGLKTALSDVMEMSARRKLFINEYDDMVDNPETYEAPTDEELESQYVKVKQLEETEEGKKKTVAMELEVGKEYSLTTPIQREGNNLQVNPKIKVLSKTLGGEFEVQMPNGQITFMKPEEFKQFKISSVSIEDEELTNMVDDVINKNLKKLKGEDAVVPEGMTPTEYMNSLDDKELVDAVEEEFAKASEELVKEREELAKKREQIAAISNEIETFQKEENLESGFVPPQPISIDQLVDFSDANKKSFLKLFTSSSSPSVETNPNQPAYVIRYNKFMNNVKNFKNRSKLQAIMFTYDQQVTLGLSGVIETSWNKAPGSFSDAQISAAKNVDTGNVMIAFVEVDKNGKQSFIDAQGSPIGEVGKPIDINKVVFSNMPTTELTYNDANKTPRYRAGEEEEAKVMSNLWKKYREALFNAGPGQYVRFGFTVSKGKAVINKYAPEKNSVEETLVPSNILSKQEVLRVNTEDYITHTDGENYKVPNGRPYIVHGDMLQIVDNNQLSINQAKTIFALLKELSNTIVGQAAGERVVFDPKKRIFLRNVLFFSSESKGGSNNVYLQGTNLHIGEKVYDIASINKSEKEIVEQLQSVYHYVNNKALKDGLAKSFTEYYIESGEIKSREWKNYQSYLLSSKTPDGKTRDINSMPITTAVSKQTTAVPYNYTRKYVTLDDLDLGFEQSMVKKEAAQKPAPQPAPKTQAYEVYNSASGPVNYTVVNTAEGPSITVVSENPTILEIVKDANKMTTIKGILQQVDLFDALDSDEDVVAKFFAYKIKAEMMAVTQQAPTASEEKQEEAPKIEDDLKIDDELDFTVDNTNPLYSLASEQKYEKMTKYDIDAFKQWAKDKLPTLEYKYLDNMITTLDGKKAFGMLDNYVAYIMKNGKRGTEYHEAFHYVFNAFLSDEERQLAFDEFRNRKGSFVDRASGKTINYVNATDLQAEEKIADEFADYRLGKLPARTLSESIRNFFKAILDFFKSFVGKKGMIDSLFDAIDTGAYATKAFPDAAKRISRRYSEIPGLSEKKVNDIVQDISALMFGKVFADNRSLFSPERLTSKELFDYVRSHPQRSAYAKMSDVLWNALTNRTKDFLKTYRIEFDEDSRITINDENASKNEYAADAFTVNYKKSSPYAIKLLVGTLIKTEKMNQSNSLGGLTLPKPNTVSSAISGMQLMPFNAAFSTLLNQFENIKTQDEFVDKLVELAKEKSEYVRLFTRLGGDITTGKIDFSKFDETDWRLFISAFEVFTKQKPEIVKQFMNDDRVTVGSGSQIGSNRELIDEWVDNMTVNATGEDSLIRKTKNYYTIDQATISGLPIGNGTQMVDFLGKLGINFTMEAYTKLKGTQKEQFSNAVKSIKKGLTSGTATVSSLKRDLDVSKGLKALANLYTRVTSTNTGTTVINTQGEQRQEFTDSNAPSYFEYMFNSVSSLDDLKQRMPQLNDTFSTNSDLLKKGGMFFNEDGERTDKYLKVQYIDGIEDVRNRKGKSTSALSIGDRLTVEINQNINGSYYVLMPADGSTEWMMNLGNRVDFELFQGEDRYEAALPTFHKYLIDEINLARDWKNRSKLLFVKNKAKELRFFNDILSNDLRAKAEKLINNSKTTQADIDAFINNNIADINESIKQYLDSTVDETIELLSNNNQVNERKNGKYSYVGLESAFAEKYKLNKRGLTERQLRDIVAFINTNYVMNNIEYHKVLFGDPYQFKIKDGILDETKRIKSFLSPRRFTFNSTEYNNFLNDKANTVGDGIELTENDYGFHQFKNFLRTITAKDVNLVSTLANLIPAYAKVNETDASSWISATSHREVKMKNGQWSEEAEAFHQWQMAYTRRNIPGYKYTNSALEAHDIDLLKKPMPKYIIEVLKPIVSGNKYNKNNIDLVLDKFSQVPIYYSAVKGTNLESLFIKMFESKADYVVVESGRKVGAEELVDLYTSNGEFNEAAFENFIEVPWDAYGIQVENSYDKEKLQTRGSQLTKLAPVDLYSNGEAVGATEERKEVIKNAVERNTSALRNLVNQGYINVLNKLGLQDNGDGTFKIVDNSAVSKALRESMLSQQMSVNAIDSVTLNEQGQFSIPFEASTNYSQIKNILYSIVNKNINSPKMNGFSGVQISAAMWENASEGRGLIIKNEETKQWEKISREEYEKLSEEDKKKVKFTSTTLKFYEDEDGKRHCEILLPNWTKKYFRGKTDEEILKYLKSEAGGKILRGIGFRIPTQALSSVEVFEVKGFLPEYMGRSVVVPSEITTKAGSDFDIDKLNMYLKSVFLDADGNVKLVEYKGSEKETKDFYGKVYDDTIKAEIEELSKYDDFRDKLVDIFEKLERLPNTDSETVMSLLGQDDLQFYSDHFNMLQNIVDQANVEEMNPSDYIKAQIQSIGAKKGEATVKLMNAQLRETYINSMYTKALENEYYDSLDELLTLPENFKRLVNPNTDSTLKELATKIDELEGVDESSVKAPLLNRNYMTNLRHSFIIAKKWVGIAAVNITGNSVAQRTKVYVKDPGFKTFLPHNTIEIDGTKYITFSTMLDKAGKYISDKLSEYANAFVDVAKDPYILKIIYSDKLVNVFMTLERIGTPTDVVAFFMNQPIIKDYIKYIDSTNQTQSQIYDKKNLDYIKSFFPAKDAAIDKARILLSDAKSLNSLLESNIKDHASVKSGKKDNLSEMQNAQQHVILDEFLRINDLAKSNFDFTQAMNYDTTSFRNADELWRKNYLTEVAEQENMISSVDEVLDSSFIGNIRTALNQSTKALGEILLFNKDEFREVLKNALGYYARSPYISAAKFIKIAEKASASFLDYIIYTKGPMMDLKSLFVDENAVADRLLKIRAEHPELRILDYFAVVSSEDGNTKSIRLRRAADTSFDENMLIGYMREMRNNTDQEINNLYNDMVKIAIAQGSYRTPNSFKHIVPLEDYAKIVSPIMKNIVVDDDIRSFSDTNWFQRNYFNDADVAVEHYPAFWGGKKDTTGRIISSFEPQFIGEDSEGEDIELYFSPSIMSNQDIKATYENKQLLKVHPNSRGAGSPIIIIPRIIPESGKRPAIDFVTGLSVPDARYKDLKKSLGLAIDKVFGYELITQNGNPVYDYNEKGEAYYIYKAVNLYGYSGMAVEYNLFPDESVFDNNTHKVEVEIPTRDILRAYVDPASIDDIPLDDSDLDFGTDEMNSDDFKC